MSEEKFTRTRPHVNVGTIGHVDHGKSHLRLMRALALSSSILCAPSAALTSVHEMDEEKERGITINSGDNSLELVTDLTICRVVQLLEEEGYEAEVIDGQIFLVEPDLKEGLEEVVREMKEKEVDNRRVVVLGGGMPSLSADVFALAAHCHDFPSFELLPAEEFSSGASRNPFQNKHEMHMRNRQTENQFRNIKRKNQFKAQRAKRGKKK